jgi:hypothetical protein
VTAGEAQRSQRPPFSDQATICTPPEAERERRNVLPSKAIGGDLPLRIEHAGQRAIAGQGERRHDRERDEHLEQREADCGSCAATGHCDRLR